MRATNLWNQLRTNFWFLPAVMASAAVLLSFALVELDVQLGARAVRRWAWIYRSGPEGARAVLSAIAGSMITVAGLTFSITMLTLQLASSQYGPRLLRNFMRDRGNQVVLGIFIATFLYCLLVLRTVHGTADDGFVPHLSVAFGVVLAVASLAVLIYFIHHVASAIRIETVLADLARETRALIDERHPDPLGDDAPERRAALARAQADVARCTRSVPARESGYVQHVDDEALMRLACEHDLLLSLDAGPGRFVIEGDALVNVATPADLPEALAERLRATISLGPDRTPQQDVAFALRRLVEIAQRSLSPGINDPTTALYCIDRMEEALVRLAEREPPTALRVDAQGRPRVLVEVSQAGPLAEASIAAVARYGLSDADVVTHLLAMLARLGPRLPAAQRGRLEALAASIRRDGEDAQRLSSDRRVLRAAQASDDERAGPC